ncbi:hypothetical protein AB0942_32250 [Streptomyces nodosus]|uniref:hypothetical protein n=1 Tax=Streptomyces nodosus TaxID=40318 RepID=UPI0034527C00
MTHPRPEHNYMSSLPPSGSGCPYGQAKRLTVSNEDMREGPERLYQAIRQQYGPVVPIHLDPEGSTHGTPAWLVIGYNELRHVCQNETLFRRDSRHWRELVEGRVPADWLLLPQVKWRDNTRFADSPHHGPRRRALQEALKRVDLAQTQRLVASYADRLIDQFVKAGSVEVIAAYAGPLPLQILASIFGLREPTEQERLLGAIHRMLAGGQQAQQADQEIAAILQGLVRDRRQRPQADLASWLIEAAPGLGDAAVREELWLMLTAGAGATTYWVVNALHQLLTDTRLRNEFNSARLTLDAVMRATLWNAPPAENVMGAFARQDTRLGGHHIKAGDMLVLSLGGANHDPALGSARDGYTASNDSHLAFGAGTHRCPDSAQDLGELIASQAIGRLWQRCPAMALADPDQPLSWGPAIVVRALTALPVQFIPSDPGARQGSVPSAFGVPSWPSQSTSSQTTSPHPPSSWPSPGPSTASTPSPTTSRRRGGHSSASGRSSLWHSLIRWRRGR